MKETSGGPSWSGDSIFSIDATGITVNRDNPFSKRSLFVEVTTKGGITAQKELTFQVDYSCDGTETFTTSSPTVPIIQYGDQQTIIADLGTAIISSKPSCPVTSYEVLSSSDGVTFTSHTGGQVEIGSSKELILKTPVSTSQLNFKIIGKTPSGGAEGEITFQYTICGGETITPIDPSVRKITTGFVNKLTVESDTEALFVVNPPYCGPVMIDFETTSDGGATFSSGAGDRVDNGPAPVDGLLRLKTDENV